MDSPEMPYGAYYTNSLKAWQLELWADQRRGVRRYEILKAQNHPDAAAQAALLEIRTSMLGLIAKALSDPPKPTSQAGDAADRSRN